MKKTIDNRVKYILQSERIQEILNQTRLRIIHFLKKTKQKYFTKQKTFIKNVAAERFGILKGIMICYFYLKNIQISWLSKQKTKPQETLDFKMNKQIEIFPFHHQLILLKKENGS